MHDFQQARGLRSDGVCDQATWIALIEASWKLGDRLVYLTSPNLRGDDIAQLQTRLGRIGFDCGRVDGILGPLTSRAITDFQRNCGLLADSVCGASTVLALERVSRQTSSGPDIATVRERERLRTTSTSLDGLHVVVGQFGGLSTLTRALARDLRLGGAVVISVDEPDAVAQADAANRFSADLYLGFEARTEVASKVCYYAVPTFESVGGRSLAERLVTGFSGIAGVETCLVGARLQVLRETRMPAVLASLGSVRHAMDHSHDFARAARVAIEQWAACPLETISNAD